MALLTYMWNSQYNLQNQATQLKPVPVKGCFVILIRNSELEGMESTMSQIEQTFNKKYNYPYVFLNNEEFSTEFRSSVKSLTNARILFGKINETMWGYPDYINQTYAAENRDRMEAQGIPYGGSESYRHMCR
jgi:alpha 1,2-mannosyltransferase